MDKSQQQKGPKPNALYADLDKAMSNSDFDRAVKVCNRLLHQTPDDELAFRCKIICCIQQNRIDDAIGFMEKNPKMMGNLAFEKAYCLYRNQDMVGAKAVLDTCPDSAGKMELMTQIKYRMESYDEAFESCRELIRSTEEDEYEEERQTNLAAINACLIASGSTRRLDKVEYDTHELRYNMACALIAEERFSDALKVLKEAEAMAVETLKEDGLTEEEIAEDTAIITIQSAYCLQKLGREKDAMAVYSKVLKNKPPEADLVAVASNNILCINKDQNIFDSKKRVKSMKTEGADAKLTQAQRRDMSINQCLFYLLTGQTELCKEACTATASKFPETETDIFLIQTALLVKTEGIPAAKAFVGKEKASSLDLNLCFVQQLLRDRDANRKQVVALLESLVADSYKPGLVGALVTMYQHDGRLEDAAALMKKAVEFYRKGQGNKNQMNMMWRTASNLLLQQGDVEDAVKSLEALLKATPDDKTTLAQLIVAYSRYDITKAHKLSSQLPPVPPSEDLDMTALESPNWLASVKLMKKSKNDSVPSTPQVQVPNTKDEEKKQSKKKKKGKCKSKQPKEFDPERKPDSERWLPKYERTGYRPKKQRRGKGDVGKGTQGADSATSAIYDMSAKLKAKGDSGSPSSPKSPPVKPSGKGKKGRSK